MNDYDLYKHDSKNRLARFVNPWKARKGPNGSFSNFVSECEIQIGSSIQES